MPTNARLVIELICRNVMHIIQNLKDEIPHLSGMLRTTITIESEGNDLQTHIFLLKR